MTNGTLESYTSNPLGDIETKAPSLMKIEKPLLKFKNTIIIS
jgi:hypothetical protein